MNIPPPNNDATLPLKPPAPDGASAAPGSASAQGLAIVGRLDTLPPCERDCLRLRHLEKLSLNGIKERLKIGELEIAAALLSAARTIQTTDAASAQPWQDEDKYAATGMLNPADDLREASAALADFLLRIDRREPANRELLAQQVPKSWPTIENYFAVGDLLDRLADIASGTLAAPTTATDAPQENTSPNTIASKPSGKAAAVQRKFGNYELLEVIGAGGMGVVYKAKQRHPARLVAIKMIRSAQFADQVEIDRFYAEANSAASLQHPNIVAIYEAGELEGRHFIAMEFVEGATLADQIRERPLVPRQAAKHALTIADAMQFAHEKGILHRDLKPVNVLVNALGALRITDFGLATEVGKGPELSQSGAILGTPGYMPPEQAQAKRELMGPASDVYSIGAILYELLTRRAPFEAANPWETIRQVIENEPVSPRLINPGVPRDLETICLKCLQKNPIARYPTAQELADELQRYLNGEPIRARPISVVSRSWRWCKRNPWLASFGAATALSIVLALAASTWGYVTATIALAKYEESFRQAREVVDDLFTRVSEDTLLNRPGLQPIRKDLLGKALAYYNRFLSQRKNDPTVKLDLAATKFRVGVITELLETPKAALPIYQEARGDLAFALIAKPDDIKIKKLLGDTVNAIGRVLQKMQALDEAAMEYDQAVSIRQDLAKQLPDDVDSQRVLANTLMNLGQVEQQRGNTTDAQQLFEKAQTIRRQILEKVEDAKVRRDSGKGAFNLAKLMSVLNVEEKADQHYQQAVDDFSKLLEVDQGNVEIQQLLSQSYGTFGDWKFSTQHINEAEEYWKKAQALLEKLVHENPGVPEYEGELAGFIMNVGKLHADQSQWEKSKQELDRAIALLRGLVKRDSAAPHYKRNLAVACYHRAAVAIDTDDAKSGKQNLKEASLLLHELIAKYPDQLEYKQLAEMVQDELIQLAPLPVAPK